MIKDDLIKTLLNAVELEESHSPFVAKFCAENFKWGDIEEDKVKKVVNLLNLIKSQTIEHERMLNDLIGQLRESDKNEF